MLTVHVHVLQLGERVAARDVAAEAEAVALAELLMPRYGGGGPVPGSIAAC